MTELNVHTRTKKESLNHLREQGRVPAICYGAHTDNILISFNEGEFRKCYREAGSSSVIQLTGDVDEQCFIQDMQVHVVSGDILHADLKIVAAGETTQVDVPIVTTGEAPAVINRIGLLRIGHPELSIEAIPSKVPSEISIDVSGLKEVGDHITIADLNLGEGVTILEDESITLVSISSFQEEDEEEDDGPTLEEVLADPNNKEEGEGDDKESEEKEA